MLEGDPDAGGSGFTVLDRSAGGAAEALMIAVGQLRFTDIVEDGLGDIGEEVVRLPGYLGSQLNQSPIKDPNPYLVRGVGEPVGRGLVAVGQPAEPGPPGGIGLTSENLMEPWIHFESGSISKSVGKSKICPYLVGISPSDIPQGPLTQFQALPANYDGTLTLVNSINKELEEKDRLKEIDLKEIFEMWWPKLEETLDKSNANPPNKGKYVRTDREILEEILNLVRGISRESEYQQVLENILKKISSHHTENYFEDSKVESVLSQLAKPRGAIDFGKF
jgi:hypothetical protein